MSTDLSVRFIKNNKERLQKIACEWYQDLS